MTSILITTCLLTIGLLFTTPVPPKEEPWNRTTTATTATTTLQRHGWYFPPPELLPTTPAQTETPALDESFSALLVQSATSPAPTPPTPQELVDSIFGWPGRQLVQCESGWNQWAVGAAGELGALQIHPVHKGLVARMGYRWEDMHQWEPNLRVAVEIRRTQGLRAWSCWQG